MKIFKVKTMYVKSYKEKEAKKYQEVLIVQCDEDNLDIWKPSKLTSYVNYKYGGEGKINTSKPPAQAIVQFMNYITKEVALGEDVAFLQLKTEGLYGLEHIHLAKFIDYISKRRERENNFETVNGKENYLVWFYYTLYKMGITKESAKVESKIIKSYKNRGEIVLINPIKNSPIVHRPVKKKGSIVLKNMDEEMWEQFIQYAEEHYPNIVLGVVIQIMGGLRRGEVVNIILDDVHIDKKSDILTLWLQDRPELFLDREIDLSQSQNKGDPAEQAIYNFNGRLYKIYENYLIWLASHANDNAKRLGALFVDDNGNAMSGDVYYNQFQKLKNEFIEILEETSPSKAQRLRRYKWGTHIGRHIFTNYLIESDAINGSDGLPNETLLQSARRDKSPISAQTYIDTETVHKAVDIVQGKMSKLAKDSIKHKK